LPIRYGRHSLAFAFEVHQRRLLRRPVINVSRIGTPVTVHATAGKLDLTVATPGAFSVSTSLRRCSFPAMVVLRRVVDCGAVLTPNRSNSSC
jgi:hypothetical protein